MNKKDFINHAYLLGYVNSKTKAEEYVKKFPKDTYTEKDLLQLYRIYETYPNEHTSGMVNLGYDCRRYLILDAIADEENWF